MPPRVSSSLLLVLLVHALWGGLPFCCRYLLVYASPPLHSATLLASARALSVLVLAAFSYVPGTTCYRVHNSETLLAAMSFPSLASPSSENLLPSNRSFASVTSSKTTYKLRASRLKMAFFFGWFTAISHLMNVLSCYFAPVYVIAFVKLLAPIMTPLADWLVLGTTLPESTKVAVAVATVGCSMMIWGEVSTSSEDSYIYTSGEISSKVWVGVAIQFLAQVTITAQRLMMKTTQGLLTSTELIMSANVMTITIGSVISLADARGFGHFADVYTMFTSSSLEAKLAFFYLSVCIFSIAAIYQVVCARLVGPGVYDSFQAVRVLVGIFTAWLLLGEGIDSYPSIVGIAITVASVTWYVLKINEWEIEKKKEEAGVLHGEGIRGTADVSDDEGLEGERARGGIGERQRIVFGQGVVEGVKF